MNSTVGKRRRAGSPRVKHYNEFLRSCRPKSCGLRAPAAWIAAFRSAIPAARWETSFPIGTIWCIATTGAGARSTARHEQLSGVHRPRLSRALRSGLRAGNQRRPGRDQANRNVDRRPRLRRRLDRARAAAVRTGKRVAVVGSGPAGLAARSNSTGPGIRSRCSSGPIGRAAC